MQSSRIQLRPGSIWIDGQPVILFSSSLFYFRIPAAEWRSRMKTLTRLGYNAIDVYFPWNYHAPEPGKWDFQGERDVKTFLQMAKEEGLWVIARPGPYICSEWDGGALPAYLNLDADLRLRQANPAYLEAVRGWYNQILPIIAGFQVGHGGTIVMMQIENELDFFDCQDRQGMMSALRDKALAAGITVPLIACAGEGDISGATGSVDGIVPTCNVYFDDRDPGVEQRVRHYARLLKDQGYPLGIIETNRAHTDLRRLVAGGAKLVGPYLQTGGTDFGFTTGITNWGSPMAFMTSHYDFGGMISPGGRVRPEGVEARLLTGMLETLGPAAALSTPVEETPVKVTGQVIPSTLSLDGGGWLIGLANLGDEPRQVCIGEAAQCFPRKVDLRIAPQRCPFILLDLPLAAWGLAGHIAYATAELASREILPDGLELSFVTAGPVEIALRLPAAQLVDHSGWKIEQADGLWRLWQADGLAGLVEFHLPENRRLRIRAVDRETAAGFSVSSINPARPQEIPASVRAWQIEALDPCAEGWLADAHACPAGRLHLEQNGIYRGFGFYRSAGLAREPKGLLVRSGADVLSIYTGSRYLGTLTPGGADAYLPWRAGSPVGPEQPLLVRAEIWGHANFDDGRLPALRLTSLRGMRGVVAVWNVDNLTSNWFYQDNAREPAGAVDPAWPYIAFGNWSTTKEPAPGMYYRAVRFASEGDSRILHFPELKVNGQVYVNQAYAGEVTPFNPWIDLSCVTRPGETFNLAIFVDRQLRGSTGPVILYQGQAIQDWALAGWGEADFARLAGRSAGGQVSPGDQVEDELPFKLAAGQISWLRTRIPESLTSAAGLDLIFEGKGLKISAWLGSHLVGRVWLPSQNRPRMAGGPDNRIYLPADWIQEAEGNLHLLVESAGENDYGELTRAVLDIEV